MNDNVRHFTPEELAGMQAVIQTALLNGQLHGLDRAAIAAAMLSAVASLAVDIHGTNREAAEDFAKMAGDQLRAFVRTYQDQLTRSRN